MRMDIAIVGAGAAGLAAWQRANTFGLRAEVFEARSRLGGRVRTDAFGSELGAEFVHGIDPRYRGLLLLAGLNASRYEGSSPAKRIYLWRGQLSSGSELDEAIDSLCAGLEAGLRGVGDRSVHQRAGELFAGATAMDVMVRFFALDRLSRTEGGDPDEIGCDGLSHNRRVDVVGWENFRLDDSYDRLISYLAEGAIVHLQSPIVRVDWRRGSVRITDALGRSTEAGAAIITIPLGPLQVGAIQFVPPLPPWKSRALGGVGVGHANKVIATLPTGLDLDFDYFHTDRAVRTWWRGSIPNQLVGFSGGSAAQLMSRDLRRALDEAADDLAILFGTTRDKFAASTVFRGVDWSSDPWARGSYTFDRVGHRGARARLAKSVDQTLFFAGEATALDGRPGTVDGAITTGMRTLSEFVESTW
jgi:monoamine oxidase